MIRNIPERTLNSGSLKRQRGPPVSTGEIRFDNGLQPDVRLKVLVY